jgi:hypothetical protein
MISGSATGGKGDTREFDSILAVKRSPAETHKPTRSRGSKIQRTPAAPPTVKPTQRTGVP